MKAGRILIADDEPQIRRALRTALEAHDFDVAVAENGDEAITRITTWNPHVVVLDLVMPVKDGLDVLRETRLWSQLPIIVLSARGQETDKVLALDLGADDYLTKPFGIDELLARIRALLRRSTSSVVEPTICVRDIVIDLEHHTVKRGDIEVHLTPTEFDLLVALASNPGKLMTHRQILERVWGGYAAENTQQLRVYIGYLRRKLENDPSHPSLILTDPGIGYRLRG